MVPLLVFCAALSALGCALLLRVGVASATRYRLDMPQRFHMGHVPRLGGAAMFLACAVCWSLLFVVDPMGLPYRARVALAIIWLLVVVLAVGAGLLEDLTQQMHARWRLVFTLGAGFAATYLLDLRIATLGGPPNNPWTLVPWMATALAVIAVAGLPHSFNLIDGYNGLASTVAVICCAAISVVAFQVGDRYILAVVLTLASATVGFLLWNYPRGLIFAGDGGAYLWGVVIAIASIQLVQRHPDVSPWFPMLMLIYPVWETFFSIYRKLMRGQSPGRADALHFHQLIYRRVVRPVQDTDHRRQMLKRNNRTSPYLWLLTLLSAVPAVLFWRDTTVLMIFSCVFVFTYIAAYVAIVRFKVPAWLRR